MSEITVMEKPVMKRRIKVYDVIGNRNNVVPFDANETTAELLNEFGHVEKVTSGAGSHYWLVVDGRFDMADVLAYMDSLNENGEVVEAE